MVPGLRLLQSHEEFSDRTDKYGHMRQGARGRPTVFPKFLDNPKFG